MVETPRSSFQAADYAVFASMLAVSAAIGLYSWWSLRRSSDAGDFLTGSRTMGALPVSMSLTASFMSSVTLVSFPAEVYRYGAIFGLLCFSYLFAVLISSEIFLPVFYRLEIASIYEVRVLFPGCISVQIVLIQILATELSIHGSGNSVDIVQDGQTLVFSFHSRCVCLFSCRRFSLLALSFTPRLWL
uniref:Solute carrier family 5 member 8 n=1 Tax=Salarias fasciatus TaxID=181472 RepID=A0A672F5E3_SALFA